MKIVKLFLRLPLLLLAVLTLTACPSDSEDDFIEASAKELTLADGQAQVNIKSNTTWNVTQLPSWVSCSAMSGSGDMLLRLTETQANPTTEERSAPMTVKCAGSNTSVTITVKQPGTPLPDDAINVSTRNVAFDAAQGTYTLIVTANNLWSLTLEYKSDEKDWLTTSIAPGTKQRDHEKPVEIKAAANTSVNTRSAELSFTCGTATPVTVRVSQAKDNARLEVIPKNLSFDSDGKADDNTFTVESNVEWTVKSSAAWCTLEIDDAPADATYTGKKTVAVKATKYESPEADREATVTIAGGGITQKVTVRQKAAERSVKPVGNFPIRFAADEVNVTKNFQITANTPWTIEVKENKGWLSVSPKAGEGDSSPATISVTVIEQNGAAEPRTAVIVIKATGTTDQEIEVVQEAAGEMLTVTPKSMEFEPMGGKKTFSITSNVSWIIEPNESWITIVGGLTGDSSKDITVSVDKPNEGETDRKGTITIRSTKNANMSEVITVIQKGIILEVSPNSLSFSKNGEEKTVTVTCNREWEVTSCPPWCKMTKRDDAITLKAEANPTASDRNSELTVKAGDVSRAVKLHQEPQLTPGADDNPLPEGYSRKTK